MKQIQKSKIRHTHGSWDNPQFDHEGEIAVQNVYGHKSGGNQNERIYKD